MLDGSQLINLVFNIANMIYGFTKTMLNVVTMTLSDFLIQGTAIGDSGNVFAQGIKAILDVVLGPLADLSLITIFSGTGLVVFMALMLIKKIVPLA